MFKVSKKTMKIITAIWIALMVVCVATSCLALTPGDINGTDNPQGSTEIQSVGNSIVGILQVVGIVLSVVVLIVLGIKYMLGSAEEKADYKKSMIPYVVGAALIFAASAFAQVIYNFFVGVTAGN